MVRPVDPDHDEAEHQREIGRPDAQQGGQQMDGLPARRMRNLDLQDEQRDRDGKDAVAERLDPPGIPLRAGAPGFAYGITTGHSCLLRSAVLARSSGCTAPDFSDTRQRYAASWVVTAAAIQFRLVSAGL